MYFSDFLMNKINDALLNSIYNNVQVLSFLIYLIHVCWRNNLFKIIIINKYWPQTDPKLFLNCIFFFWTEAGFLPSFSISTPTVRIHLIIFKWVSDTLLNLLTGEALQKTSNAWLAFFLTSPSYSTAQIHYLCSQSKYITPSRRG